MIPKKWPNVFAVLGAYEVSLSMYSAFFKGGIMESELLLLDRLIVLGTLAFLVVIYESVRYKFFKKGPSVSVKVVAEKVDNETETKN